MMTYFRSSIIKYASCISQDGRDKRIGLFWIRSPSRHGSKCIIPTFVLISKGQDEWCYTVHSTPFVLHLLFPHHWVLFHVSLFRFFLLHSTEFTYKTSIDDVRNMFNCLWYPFSHTNEIFDQWSVSRIGWSERPLMKKNKSL